MIVQQETLGDNYSGDMQPVGELYVLEVWNVQCLDPQFSIWRSSRKACSTSCSTSKELKSPSSLVSNMSNLNTVGSAVRIVCLLQCTENMSSSLRFHVASGAEHKTDLLIIWGHKLTAQGQGLSCWAWKCNVGDAAERIMPNECTKAQRLEWVT